MEKIYFATTNEQKLRQAQRVLGDTFDVQGLSINNPENGTTCKENACQKLQTARREFEVQAIIMTDDYSIEIEGLALGDICTKNIIKNLVKDLTIEARQVAKLPFPGVFANRILRHFDEQELVRLILQLNPGKLAEAKVALAVYQTRASIENVIIKSCTLRLQEIFSDQGWFWNRIYQDISGIECTSELWQMINGPRAKALRELKASLG